MLALVGEKKDGGTAIGKKRLKPLWGKKAYGTIIGKKERKKGRGLKR